MSSWLNKWFGEIMCIFILAIIFLGAALFQFGDLSLLILVECPLILTGFGLFLYHETGDDPKYHRYVGIPAVLIGIPATIIGVLVIVAGNIMAGVDPFAVSGSVDKPGQWIVLLVALTLVLPPLCMCYNEGKSNSSGFQTSREVSLVASEAQPQVGKYNCQYCSKSFSSEQAKNDHERWCKRKSEEKAKREE
ncbi:MAG: hypothetical protein ACFFEF_16485 [Candidatus Thorarchaeota archaeon]